MKIYSYLREFPIRITLADRRKSKSFATLGWGVEHEIEEIWWTFATLEGDS